MQSGEVCAPKRLRSAEVRSSPAIRFALDGLGDEVVDVGCDHARLNELSNRRIAGKDHSAVNLGSIVRTACNAGLIDKNPKGFALLRRGGFCGDPLLNFHRLAVPPGLDSFRNLPGHSGGAGPLFPRIGEDSETLKACRSDEVEQGRKVFLSLSGESDDERCANSKSWNSATKPVDQVFDMLPGCFSAHGGEHLVAYVLERHVDIPGDLRISRDSADQLVAPMGGMRVEQSDPKIAFNRGKLIQETNKRRSTLRIQRLARSGFFLPEIHPEIRCILTYQVNLLYSFGDEMADFRSY